MTTTHTQTMHQTEVLTSCPRTKSIPLMILLLLTSFASIGAMIFAPALPQIADLFHVSIAKAEMVMGIYLIGYAIGQLFYGRAANTWGRKTALMLGVTISIIGAGVGLLANALHNFDLLLLSRLMNSLGASAGLVITMILIRDLYDADMARKVFSKVVLCFAIVPFLATAIGGYLTHYFGWNSINLFLTLYAVMLLVLVSRLPETLSSNEKQAFDLLGLFKTYKELLKSSNYKRLIFIQGVGSNSNYIFNAIAPIVAINVIHLSAVQYSWFSILPSAGILLGAWLSGRYAHRFSPKQIISYGISMMLLGSVLLFMLLKLSLMTPIFLFLPAFILFCGTSLVVPNASMYALSQVKDHANGAAFMNASTLAMSSILVSLAGKLILHGALVLPLLLIIIGLSGQWILRKIT